MGIATLRAFLTFRWYFAVLLSRLGMVTVACRPPKTPVGALSRCLMGGSPTSRASLWKARRMEAHMGRRMFETLTLSVFRLLWWIFKVHCARLRPALVLSRVPIVLVPCRMFRATVPTRPLMMSQLPVTRLQSSSPKPRCPSPWRSVATPARARASRSSGSCLRVARLPPPVCARRCARPRLRSWSRPWRTPPSCTGVTAMLKPSPPSAPTRTSATRWSSSATRTALLAR
mmetsp:Transcript_37001/g.111819  ORF Transcript_37001/g.111819 Transcript_37001/m.111819 type:complete len:230 (-) Transcript_37001:186-875(-)